MAMPPAILAVIVATVGGQSARMGACSRRRQSRKQHRRYHDRSHRIPRPGNATLRTACPISRSDACPNICPSARHGRFAASRRRGLPSAAKSKMPRSGCRRRRLVTHRSSPGRERGYGRCGSAPAARQPAGRDDPWQLSGQRRDRGVLRGSFRPIRAPRLPTGGYGALRRTRSDRHRPTPRSACRHRSGRTARRPRKGAGSTWRPRNESPGRQQFAHG